MGSATAANGAAACFDIVANTRLTEVDGLVNLRSVGGELNFFRNWDLASLRGLDRIAPGQIRSTARIRDSALKRSS
jgi:hypothetical protein